MEAKIIRVLVTVFVAGVLAGSVAAAQEPPEISGSAVAEPPPTRNWQLRFGFIVADTSGSTAVDVDPGEVNVSLSGGGGGFIGLERRLSPLLGVEFALTGIGADVNVRTRSGLKHLGTDANVLTMGALTLGANFHFVNEGPIDVYAGPLLSFNRYAEFSFRSEIGGDWWPAKHDGWLRVETRSDSELSWGAKVGLDIDLGRRRRWTLGGSLTYLDATYNFKRISEPGRGSVSLDPLMFGFGAGFRF